MSAPPDPDRVRLVQEALVGRLLPELVHQLRNPINSILTGAELLRTKGDQPQLRDKLLPVLLRSSERLRDLLETTDARQGLEAEDDFELRAAVQDALVLLQCRRHTVATHAPDGGQSLWIRGESSLLRILLLLLLEEGKCAASEELRIDISETPHSAVLTLTSDRAKETEKDSHAFIAEVAQHLGCTVLRTGACPPDGDSRTIVTFPKQVARTPEGDAS